MEINEIDFTSIDYLSQGTEKQRQAYAALRDLKIMDLLQEYEPILVGTVPIDGRRSRLLDGC